MKFAIRNSLLFVLFVSFFFCLSGQAVLPSWDWQLPTLSGPEIGAYAGTSLDNGQYFLLGSKPVPQCSFDHKRLWVLDDNGQLVNTNNLGVGITYFTQDVQIIPNDFGGVTTLYNSAVSTSTYHGSVIVYDSLMGIVWDATLPLPQNNKRLYDITATADGGYMLVGGRTTGRMMKLDSLGNIEWDSLDIEIGVFRDFREVVATPDSHVVVCPADGSGFSWADSTLLQKRDLQGNLVWEVKFLGSRGSRISVDGDGNTWMVTTLAGSTTSLFLYKVDPGGNVLISKAMTMDEIPIHSRVVTFHEGGGYIVGAEYPNYTHVVVRFDELGNELWNRKFPFSLNQSPVIVDTTNDRGLFVGGSIVVPPNFALRPYAYRLDSLGNLHKNLVTGTIFLDADKDCIRDSNEYGIPNILIEAHPDQELTMSNGAGEYILRLGSGAKALTLFNPLIDGSIDFCHPGDSVFFVLPNQNDTLDSLDIPVILNDSCPRMLVEASSLLFRNCDSTKLYLSYANISADSINNSYIEFELDPLLSLTSASLPFISLGGNLYRFNLPPTAPFQTGNITVDVFVACNTVLGQAVCNVAHIYPDSGCPEISPLWSQASLAVTGTCNPPGVAQFEIKNVGTGAMTAPTSFIIVEDDVLRYSGTVLLNPGEDSTYAFTTNGSTWACFADQVGNHPFNSIPRAFVEGCGLNGGGSFSTGHVNNHPQDDLVPFHSIDCDVIVNSSDPNAKSVIPIGTHQEHRISADDPLEYMIRFQNVGNDTALRVVIHDQIAAALDLSTFVMLDASHPYIVSFHPNQVVEWVFDPIALVDSFTNEPGSHGFVKFVCEQVPGNAPGTVIENEAEIYFDDNGAIVTNTTLNTIYEEGDMFLVQVDEVVRQGNPLIVYPNPAHSEAKFRFEQHGYPQLHFELFNLNGQRLRDIHYGQIQEFTMQREGLTNGIYLFRITSQGMPIASGKIIVE